MATRVVPQDTSYPEDVAVIISAFQDYNSAPTNIVLPLATSVSDSSHIPTLLLEIPNSLPDQVRHNARQFCQVFAVCTQYLAGYSALPSPPSIVEHDADSVTFCWSSSVALLEFERDHAIFTISLPQPHTFLQHRLNCRGAVLLLPSGSTEDRRRTIRTLLYIMHVLLWAPQFKKMLTLSEDADPLDVAKLEWKKLPIHNVGFELWPSASPQLKDIAQALRSVLRDFDHTTGLKLEEAVATRALQLFWILTELSIPFPAPKVQAGDDGEIIYQWSSPSILITCEPENFLTYTLSLPPPYHQARHHLNCRAQAFQETATLGHVLDSCYIIESLTWAFESFDKIANGDTAELEKLL